MRFNNQQHADSAKLTTTHATTTAPTTKAKSATASSIKNVKMLTVVETKEHALQRARTLTYW